LQELSKVLALVLKLPLASSFSGKFTCSPTGYTGDFPLSKTLGTKKVEGSFLVK